MTLFNPRALKSAIGTPGTIPPKHLEVLSAWAESISDASIYGRNEIQLEGDFKSRIMETVLGYAPFGSGRPQTIQAKQQMGKGTVDLALGRFDADAAEIIAPFELKGADTRDLDAPMPGRKITPVEQAWNYANAVSGVRWVLVTNFVELRLYAFGEGNQTYDSFKLAKLTDPAEYARFRYVLSAENLLDGPTLALLEASRKADKDVSEQLYADYKALRDNLISAVNAATGGKSPVQAISTAQKILDRVLFIAFAEDSLLLPKESIKQAYTSRDLYNPRPIWHNFRALFKAIDQGNSDLKINSYNGGLFKPDPAIDGIELPDEICEGFQKLGAYDFESEVGVTILGHIFEQSVADIERLQAIARGEIVVEEKKNGTSGRRKRDGIVYTPDYIARFIVEKTLGAHVDELFWASMAKFATGFESHDYEALKFGKQRGKVEALKNEQQAWKDYRFNLQLMRVVDPACGSGVFLVTAFDFLRAEYDRVNKKIRELRGEKDVLGDIEDVDREILSQNLYGVDVNDESVEITKLSLWLKTARKGKKLDSLDHSIRIGDSLIEDSNFAYLKHGFEWRKAFPEVFAAGGFDVVLGNPPYVRMELIKAMKPYLETRFDVVSDRADLYCYFYERGLRILKPSGRLGYISSSTFFKTGSGGPLRNYLLKEAEIETVTDFGDLQIFEGVTTYPAILTMRRNKAAAGHAISFWKLGALPEGDFSTAFGASAQPFPQAKLGAGSWELENPALRALREKIVVGKKTLKEVYGSPQRGIVTGLNEAFVIDRATHDQLVRDDPESAELLKPFLEGKDLKRWCAEPRDLSIIYIPKNTIDINHYPAIKVHLLPFRVQLEGRATKQEWFELQQAQAAYVPQFEAPKIVYGEFADDNIFSIDRWQHYLNNKCYFVPTDDGALLALLNCSIFRFVIEALSVAMRGNFSQLHSQYVELFPIPDGIDLPKLGMASKATVCGSARHEQMDRETAFRRRIPDLCPRDRDPKLNTKLNEWWTLETFAAFRDEIKKYYRAEIPLAERTQWEDWFNAGKSEIDKLSAEIARNEAEINAIVYQLFDLTPNEVKLLEDSLR
jgi:N-6 DNA Methylase/TaqI-like C-terminal specificity domain